MAVDGSTDGTQTMLAELTLPYPIQVTDTGGRGRAAACNAALTLARG